MFKNYIKPKYEKKEAGNSGLFEIIKLKMVMAL